MRGRTRGITTFLAIAFGLAWLPCIPALFGADPFGGLLMPIAPALACVVVRRWVTREGFADAGLRPNRLTGGEPTAKRVQTLITFPIATTVISVFLGWIMLRSGSVWSASVAHAADNLTQLNLTRLVFTGWDGGTLPTSSSVPIILAKAVVLLGVVVLAAGWRQRTAATELAVRTQ